MDQLPSPTSYLETIAGLLASLEARRSKQPPEGSRERGRSDGKSTSANKTHAAKVLLFGKLRELALYRAEVLAAHGFNVTAPSSKAEALGAIRFDDPDIVVLTYTLSTDVVEEIAEVVRQECPQCLLVVITDRRTSDQKIRPDEIVLADDGPKALLAALRHALQKRSLRKH